MRQKYAIVIVAVLIIVGLVYWFKRQPVKTAQAPASQQVSPQTLQSVPVTTVATSKLPKGFPNDIPLEAGAVITQNYNAVNAAGMFQSSRTFVSAKTMADNFSLYQTSLKKSGWTITNAINDTAKNRYIILATKGGNSLNILISNVNNQVTVSINNETKP